MPIRMLLSRLALPCGLVLLTTFQSGRSRLHAQEAPSWKVRHYSVEHGLSQTSSTSMAQDSTGFLWISSEDGVNRFDGRHFKVYRQAMEQGRPVLVTRISQVLCTKDDRIIAGTHERGLLVLDRGTDRFHAYPVRPAHTDVSAANMVVTLEAANEGRILAGTFGGAYAFDPKDGTYTDLGPLFPEGLQEMYVTGAARTGGGMLVTLADAKGPSRALAVFRDDFRSMIRLDHVSLGLPDPSGQLFTVRRMADHTVQVLASRRLFQLEEGATPHFIELPLEGIPNLRGHIRSDGHGLAYTTGGLFHCGPAGEMTPIPLPITKPKDGQRVVNCLFRGHDGVIWVGTYQGIFQIDPVSARLSHRGGAEDSLLGLNEPKVRSLLLDRTGRLWLGTHNGIHVVARDGRSVTQVHTPARDALGIECRALVQDGTGAIWAHTRRNGLFRFEEDMSHATVVHDPQRPGGIIDGFTLMLDDDGKLFTGVLLDRLDIATGEYLYTPAVAERFNGRPLAVPFCFYKDRTGQYWMGTMNHGLYTFRKDPSTGQLSMLAHHLADPGDDRSISHDFVTCVREDALGNVWLGTYGGGLERYDRKSGAFHHLTVDDGLPNNVIYALEIDDRNRIWCSSNAGIACVDPATGAIRTFGTADGAQSLEFNANASFKAGNGELFFGGINGFNRFHPDRICTNPFVPQVAFTDIVLGHGFDGTRESRMESMPLLGRDTLVLQHNENDFTVRFAVLSFIQPERNSAAFMLRGYKDQWVGLGTADQISFTNLDPGRYELRVKAANNDGIWNEAYRSLHLNILPPWYRTSLATALFIFLTGSFLFGLGWIILSRIRLRYQLAREHEEAEEARAQDERRSRFFINVAHDLRTPLTLIKQRVDQIASHPNSQVDDTSTQILRRSVDKLTGRITALLETAQQDKDHIALHAAPGHVNELLHMIVADFRPMAMDRRIELTFSPAAGDPVAELDREKLTMAVENLLNNAFKFTPDGGTIGVTASSTRLMDGVGSVRITVRDSGIGIAPEDQERVLNLYERGTGTQVAGKVGAGVGLFHVRRVAEMHGGRCWIESATGKGTAVHLELPMGLPGSVTTAAPAFARIEPAIETSLPMDPAPDEHDNRPIALVIEDDPDLNTAIAELLWTEFRTHRALNGEEGISKAFDLVPDVILTDVMMPGKDGFEVCRVLKADARTSHVPVIVLTAITDLEEKIRGLYEGADDFLPKPYEPREVLARARNAVARTRKVMDLNRAAMSAPAAAPLDPSKEPERAFLAKVDEAITAHLNDPSLDVVKLGTLVAMSKSNISRKLAALIGRAPGELIREKRMTTARALLESGTCNVGETMVRVGYENLPSFSNAFKDYWGQPPSHFIKRG